jgi:hypothetical protein
VNLAVIAAKAFCKQRLLDRIVFSRVPVCGQFRELPSLISLGQRLPFLLDLS